MHKRKRATKQCYKAEHPAAIAAAKQAAADASDHDGELAALRKQLESHVKTLECPITQVMSMPVIQIDARQK